MGTLLTQPIQLGNALSDIMLCPEIIPGDDVSYQVCKNLFLWHPLGFKMTCAPLQLAMAEGRSITVPDSPGERTVEALAEQWEELGADMIIFQAMAMSRVYGISSIGLLIDGVETKAALDPWSLPDANIAFNIFDPLNTSGSLILNQNPTAMDFMKINPDRGIEVQGSAFHRSRSVTMMNEFPVYISYTTSAFGFVGRSVYQRAFFPMKSYLKSMITDDMIETKVGVLVAKIKQAGSIANAVMRAAAAFKRQVVKEAETQNVINITPDEGIESLNLQNMDGPHGLARRNILENIATSADMPIKLLAQEAFVEGFGEGTEDARAVARYIDRVRREMGPLYKFMDRICMFRAWSPAFFEGMKRDFPQTYGDLDYKSAFYRWANSLKAEWPSILKEPESELARLEDVKLKAVIALIQVFEPVLDSENKLTLYQWATDNISANKTMFVSPLEFDFETLEAHLDEQAEKQEEQAKAEQMGMMGGGMGGEDDREVPVKLGKADSSLMQRFEKAAMLLDKQVPEARDVIPIDKLRQLLHRPRH